MNCECIYLIKENTLEAARDFSKRVTKHANHYKEELYPVCISEVTNDFRATSDYDACEREFTVSKGQIVVFVYGRYNAMRGMILPGGKLAFIHSDEVFMKCIKDIEEIKD